MTENPQSPVIDQLHEAVDQLGTRVEAVKQEIGNFVAEEVTPVLNDLIGKIETFADELARVVDQLPDTES